MGKVFCRTFQAGLKIGNYFLGYRMPEYIEGAGSIAKLAGLLTEKNVNDVLVVIGRHIRHSELPKPMYESFDKAGIRYTLFSEIDANPTSDNVEAGYKAYKDNNCKAIVAFGGGSPMDCAKAIGARVAQPKKTVAQLQGLMKVHKRIPLFFAVPTTSGTGSETTVAAVITDSVTHRKASINDPVLLPSYAVLDPELTVGLPPHITAFTGMDALCHAVESYTNYTYCTQLEKDLAIKAVSLIHDNLYKAYTDGTNIEARQNMQFASFYAGRSFTRGCVGYVHAVGHTLSGLYGVAHGEAMAIILPHVMRQFGQSAHKRLAELADACGITKDLIEGRGFSEGKAITSVLTTADKANAFIEWIEYLKEQMEIPVGVDCIKDEDIPQMISWAMKESNPLYPVPDIWDEKGFKTLIDTLRTSASSQLRKA